MELTLAVLKPENCHVMFISLSFPCKVKHVAGHSQMCQKGVLIRQRKKNILASSAYLFNFFSSQGRSQLAQVGFNNFRSENLDFLNSSTQDSLFQSCYYGFDFRQLWHAISSNRPGLSSNPRNLSGP